MASDAGAVKFHLKVQVTVMCLDLMLVSGSGLPFETLKSHAAGRWEDPGQEVEVQKQDIRFACGSSVVCLMSLSTNAYFLH